MKISEKAAFNYALLSSPVALYPRSLFQRFFPLTEADFSPDTLTRISDTLARYQKQERQAQGQDQAFLQLLIQGAGSALDFLKTTNDLSGFDVMGTIEAYYDVVKEYYPGRLKLSWRQRSPYVVDQYPEPAQDANWFASSNVPGGPREGYPEGVYYLRRHMMPGVVEMATLHENVHHLGLGNDDVPGDYYRFFDEGCANFLAYLVYYHKNRNLQPIQLYRTFLQEINTDLYETPAFDRIMASLIHQVGTAGLYRLILRRLKENGTQVDWKGLLRAVAAGQLQVEPLPDEPSDAELPPIVHELQEGADKMIGIITYPDRVLMSPVAYLAYDWVCREGTLGVADLQAAFRLSAAEVEAVIQELGGIYFWTHDSGQLKPFPPQHNSDFFHNTGLIRAAISGVALTVA
ncbi:MAG: hypothetical protein BroJett011_15890 [Chloroflexota bacterium]|nr:MAG: hypothetical protein BroJett011_15890 [Chloroflexota bacterium]